MNKTMVMLVVFVSLLINTFLLGSIPAGLHGDEAQHGLQAIAILKGKNHIFDFGWYGLPIPSFFAQAAGVFVFGKTIFALRIPSAIIGTLTLIPFYFLVLLLFDRKTALFSLIFLATSHWWIALSRLGENYIQVPFVAVVGFLFIVLGFRTKNVWIAVLAGIAIGLNFYLYFAARLTPILEIFLIANYARTVKPRWTYIKILLCVFIGFLITVLPFFMVSVQHGGLAFSRQNDVYIYGTGLGSRWRQETYGNSDMWKVISGQLHRTFYLKNTWHDTSGQYGYRGWVIDPVSGIFFILGFLGLIFIGVSGFTLFPLAWLLLTIFTGWILTENPPFSPRVVGAIPALAIIIGYGMTALTSSVRKLSSMLRIVIVAAVILFVTSYNINAYFVRGVREEWGDANKYTATDIALKMNTLPGYTTVFLTAPYIHADFGPIQYLTTNPKVVSVENPILFQPMPTQRTLFIVHPEYEFLLKKIIETNSNGVLDRVISQGGNTRIMFYQVN